MKKAFAISFLLVVSTISWSQSTVDIKVYNWEELDAVNPDTIYGVSFAKMKLDQLPNELKAYKNLQVLNLEKNKLEELPAFFTQFKYLKELNLGKNKLFVFPLAICQLDSLQRLILNRNGFDRLPECIESLRSLKYLDLYDTPIESLPNNLALLYQLEEIDFTGIRFSPAFQDKWKELLPETNLIFDVPCDCMEK